MRTRVTSVSNSERAMKNQAERFCVPSVLIIHRGGAWGPCKTKQRSLRLVTISYSGREQRAACTNPNRVPCGWHWVCAPPGLGASRFSAGAGALASSRAALWLPAVPCSRVPAEQACSRRLGVSLLTTIVCSLLVTFFLTFCGLFSSCHMSFVCVVLEFCC